jgi:hypothetical protein
MAGMAGNGRSDMAIAGMAGIASRFAGNGREWHRIFPEWQGVASPFAKMAGMALHLARMAGVAWYRWEGEG